jgi:hypothetical protein
MTAAGLPVCRFVFLADCDNDDAGSLLVYLVEHAVIATRPDAELVVAAGDPVAPPRAGDLLQVQDRPGDAQEAVIVESEEFAFGGPSEPDPKHGSS